MIFILLLSLLSSAPKSEPVLLVLNKSENTIAFVDPISLRILGKANTGVGPHEVAVAPDGRIAYVVNYGAQSPGNSLSVIDILNRKELRKINLGEYKRPHGIAVTKDGKHLVVTCEENQAVLVIDLKTEEIVKVLKTHQELTHMLVLSPDMEWIFTANIRSGTVTAIHIPSASIHQIPVGQGPEGIDISPDGKEVWVANRAGDDLAIINVRSLEVDTILPTGEFPIRLKFTPNGKIVLVSNAREGSISFFDTEKRKEIARIDTGTVPIGILIHPDGKRVFIANSRDDQVSILDLKKRKVIETIRPGKTPDGLGWANPR